MNFRTLYKLSICGFLAAVLLLAGRLTAQHLTLEGQTGGFLTPTAYVVESAKGQVLSHPAIGIHYINASTVIGLIETFSITEGFANRAELGYTHSNHTLGNTPVATATNAATSSLWSASGMNIVHGKVVLFKDGQFGPAMPGVAVGGVIRNNDQFVSGAIYQELTGMSKGYTNGDVYISVTKTWAKPPVPFLLNLGWKATNAVIFGIGGQSTRFGGRFYGGLGIPLPLTHGIVAVPSAGFTQEPKTVVGLGPWTGINVPLLSQRADLPTTLDYAVRVTQRDHPHFAFDIGIGQVAGNIGAVPTGYPPPYPTSIPVNLEARKVVGTGLSYRY
jgi:hypothetical protein